MSTVREIPRDVRRVQIEAADPHVSAFVSANAGSGKTHVLAQRVINLLLGGVDPAKILCITFTKAAAANMANRVFDTLAEWTTLDDRALDGRILLSTNRKPDAVMRARARRLFASALETPGGLKVQTIHAFCTQLLHQFPFEANVAARFTVLDEAATAELLERLTLDVLLEASAGPDSALGKALETAIVVAADSTFKDVIGEAIRQRDAISAWIDRADGGIDAAISDLSRALGVDVDDSESRICRECETLGIAAEDWPRLADIFAAGKRFDVYQSARWRRATQRGWPSAIDEYLSVFLRDEDGTPKGDAYLMGKDLRAEHAALWAQLDAERTRVEPCLQRLRAVRARERTRALITIAKAVIDRYQTEKDRRGLLDYDDLIDKALPLLSDGSAAWVHYKLDLGIDHMLIDEAQDTSPKQWQIIQLLASEFVPGGSRPDVRRTIFAVGDEKQSIFSFQGAAPAAFDEMRRHFERQFNIPELGWRYLRFHHSFRSGKAVLGSVDRVFSTRAIYESITTDVTGIPEHLALPEAAPGLVELWPLMEPAEKREIEGWDAPFDTESEQSPRVRLAQRIARHVKLWTARGLNPGKVLVLVRQRGPLFEAIIRAMKDAGVPVAGADRLVLTEHIAVMDLMALADCLLLDDDDLALASVLKSPLFGLGEEQLFELAWERKDSLRDALRARAGDALFGAVNAEFDRLGGNARRLSPFGFFADVLGPRHGRRKFLARLGPEANDALDEFLNLALDYERRETPSLQGFLAWLRAAQSEVKRDMELARDEVRVMTVHGAKGLEAHTVILADTTTEPKGTHPPRLLALKDNGLVWATRRQDDTTEMEESRDAANDAAVNEYRRLLYVAMTRAEQRLVIAGAKGENRIPEGCWYQLVDDALRADCVTESADDEDGDVLRYRKGEAPLAQPSEPVTTAAPVSLSPWLTCDAPTERKALRKTPSSALDDDEARPGSPGGAGIARLRGLLAHRLLQSLPDVPPERRTGAAEAFLARRGTDLPAEERKALADKVAAVLDDARFAPLFARGSRAEVPVVGNVETGGNTWRVSGQVDRLAVTTDAVLIADYKTNRPAPRRIEQVPQSYVAQLALYRAVLAKLYPDRPVRCALVWTEVPDLMDVSDDDLDRALARITPA